MNQKNRLSSGARFVRGLSIYFIVCLALIFIVLAVLWHYLSVYEASRPEAPVEEYLASRTEDDWLDVICGKSTLDLTEFESHDDLRSLARKRYFSGSPLTYSLAAGSGDEVKAYDIYSGNTKMATLHTAKADGIGYGLNRWELSIVEMHVLITPESSRTLKILAPSDSEVTVNGRPVGRGYITKSDISYDDLSEYERRDGYNAPTRCEYTVSGLYIEPDISVSGARLVSGGDMDYEYIHSGKGSFDLSFSAPSTASITVSGLTLGPDDFTKGPSDVGFDELKRYLDDIPGTVSIHWEGLAFKPNVTVRDALGNIIEPDDSGDYSLRESSSLRAEAGGTVDRFSELYLNFCTNIGGDTYAVYDSMTPYMIWGSELQKRLNNAKDGYSWVSGVSNDIHDLSSSNYRRYSETLGCCDLHMKVSTRTYYEVRETDTTIHIVLMKVDGRWKIASMTTVK